MQIPSNLPVFTASRRNGPAFKAAANTQAPSPLFAGEEKKRAPKLALLALIPSLLFPTAIGANKSSAETRKPASELSATAEVSSSLAKEDKAILEQIESLQSLMKGKNIKKLWDLKPQREFSEFSEERQIGFRFGDDETEYYLIQTTDKFNGERRYEIGTWSKPRFLCLSIPKNGSPTVEITSWEPSIPPSMVYLINKQSSENPKTVEAVKAFFEQLNNTLNEKLPR